MSCQLHKNQKIYKQFQLATSSINWVFIQNFVQTQCQTKNKGNPENNFFKFLQAKHKLDELRFKNLK